MPRKKAEELELYDYYRDKSTLRYVGRPESVKDTGISRTLSTPHFTEKDNLCKLFYGDLLTGEALADAQANCPPKPEGFVLPDRFIKKYGETD